jgi:hypothetical protein
VLLADAATATPRWLKRVSNAHPREGRLRPLWVRTDKTHREHNEFGYPSVADMRADIDQRCYVPIAEKSDRSIEECRAEAIESGGVGHENALDRGRGTKFMSMKARRLAGVRLSALTVVETSTVFTGSCLQLR